jgi:hypothetical protein
MNSGNVDQLFTPKINRVMKTMMKLCAKITLLRHAACKM